MVFLLAIDKKGLRNYYMSICVRRHGQNQDTQLSFKALHQIIRSHHKGTWENPERSDCTINFILQTYI